MYHFSKIQNNSALGVSNNTPKEPKRSPIAKFHKLLCQLGVNSYIKIMTSIHIIVVNEESNVNDDISKDRYTLSDCTKTPNTVQSQDLGEPSVITQPFDG